MPAIDRWLPLAVALIVPGLGTLYSVGQHDADAKATQGRVQELEKRVTAATDTAVAASIRVDQLEVRARMVDDTLRDISSQLRKVDGNLIALCAATHGAQCVR